MDYSTTLSIVVPVDYRRKLDRLAQERSIKEMRRVSICELVRNALDQVYGSIGEDIGQDQAEDRSRPEGGTGE